MSSSLSARVRAHRERLRAAGLRRVQIWVPDTRRPGFDEECRRQAERVAASEAHEQHVRDWLEAASDREGWT
jgi:hypothetical protein